MFQRQGLQYLDVWYKLWNLTYNFFFSNKYGQSNLLYFLKEGNLGTLNHRLRNRSNPLILIRARILLIWLAIALHLLFRIFDFEKLINFFTRLQPGSDTRWQYEEWEKKGSFSEYEEANFIYTSCWPVSSRLLIGAFQTFFSLICIRPISAAKLLHVWFWLTLIFSSCLSFLILAFWQQIRVQNWRL